MILSVLLFHSSLFSSCFSRFGTYLFKLTSLIGGSYLVHVREMGSGSIAVKDPG